MKNIEQVSTGYLVKTLNPLVLITPEDLEPSEPLEVEDIEVDGICADLEVQTGEAFIGHVPRPHH